MDGDVLIGLRIPCLSVGKSDNLLVIQGSYILHVHIEVAGAHLLPAVGAGHVLIADDMHIDRNTGSGYGLHDDLVVYALEQHA